MKKIESRIVEFGIPSQDELQPLEQSKEYIDIGKFVMINSVNRLDLTDPILVNALRGYDRNAIFLLYEQVVLCSLIQQFIEYTIIRNIIDSGVELNRGQLLELLFRTGRDITNDIVDIEFSMNGPSLDMAWNDRIGLDEGDSLTLRWGDIEVTKVKHRNETCFRVENDIEIKLKE